MKCPKCGSEHVQFATSTKGGGFSFFDSCCGYILLGPLGLLCGALGSGTHTDEFWICHDCGHKFSTARGKENLREEEKRANEYQQNKAILTASGNKTHEELEADLNETKKELDNTANNYREFLNKFIDGNDKQLSKYAKVLKNDNWKYWAWIVLFISGVLTFAGCIPALVFAIPSAVYLVIHCTRAKRARGALSEADPEFLVMMNAVKNAETKNKRAEELHKTSQAVKDYEAQNRKR